MMTMMMMIRINGAGGVFFIFFINLQPLKKGTGLPYRHPDTVLE